MHPLAAAPPVGVLLVEDDPGFAYAVTRTLESTRAWRVHSVGTLAGALLRLADGGIAAVLLDLVLPDSEGLGTLDVLVDAHPHVPVVVLTGATGAAIGADALRRGAQDFVPKSELSDGAVDRALRYAIERHQRAALSRQVTEVRNDMVVLREAQAGQAAIMDALPAHIAVLDRDGLILAVNENWRRFARANGLSDPACGVRDNYLEVCERAASTGSNEAKEALLSLRGVLSGGSPRAEMEYACHAPGEERWFRLMVARLAPAAGVDQGAVVVMHVDVTERARLEEQLRHAQKMEAVGRLAGGIAHDFNNLLTAILGYADLTLRQLPVEAEPIRGKIQEIKRAGERAAALTRQLLAFSRKQVLVLENLDPAAVLNDLTSLMQRLLGEHIELVTLVAPDLPLLRADRGQLEQVVTNLVVNARDAMPEGGRLVLELTSAASPDLGTVVILTVTDTGTGMNPETLSHVFEPFYTTKPQGQGTGLGLATVFGIVKQLGGNIGVASASGRGAVFTITLPALSRSVAAVVAPERLERREVGGGETILLAEDEGLVRGLCSDILGGLGYRVLAAGSGAEALRIAQSASTLDLLLTDVVMPGMGGRELAEHLRVLRPALRVLYMSGYTDDAVMRRGALSEGAAFLQKPFSANGLAVRVREALDARHPP